MDLQRITLYLKTMRRWFFPLPYIWVSTTIYVGVLLTYTAYHILYAYTPINAPLIVSIMLTLIIFDRYEFHRFGEKAPYYIALLFLFYRLILIELVGFHLDIYYLSFLYAFLPFIAVMQLGWRAGYLTGITVWILYMLKISVIYPFWTQNVIYVDGVLTFHIMLGFTLVMAKVILREKQSRQQTETLMTALEHSHQQLQEYAEQVETLATIQERSRIARDIHDTLGHYLTAISIQMEKADVFFNRNPETARLSIQQSKSMADEALREVRHSVGILRTSKHEFALQPALTRMIESSRSNQLDIQLKIDGSLNDLPELLTMSLYRAVQEGLTNVRKHANASQVFIHITVDGQSVKLALRDNGRGFKTSLLQQQHGYGLNGLRERLRLVGGSLNIISDPGNNTELQVYIPMMRTA